MKRGIIVLLALVLFITLVSNVLADGGYFPRPDYWVVPGQQKAIIFHEDNIETLILTSNFKGNAKDLVWIIPTPTIPDITKANEEIFTNIQKIANPVYDYGYSLATVSKGMSEGYDNVLIIDSLKVDYYDAKVLSANNAYKLAQWFNDYGYSYPQEYAYVLQSYMDKGWFFTAIRISPEAQGATEVIQDLREGHPTPIKLTFLSDKIVFPLKISSVEFKPEKKYLPAKDEPVGATRTDADGSVWTKKTIDPQDANWCRTYSGGGSGCINNDYIDQQPGGINYNIYNYNNYIPINLYIISDGKYETSNFNIQYGNWITKKQIEKLGYDDNGDSLIQPKDSKYFLTYMYASLQKSQMDDDIYLKKAEDNKKVNAGPETWQLFLYGLFIGILMIIIWIFTPLGILFVFGSLILFLSQNKTARVFGWIMEIFSLAISAIIALVFFIILVSNGAWNYVTISVLITSLFLFILMIIMIILQIKYKKEEDGIVIRRK